MHLCAAGNGEDINSRMRRPQPFSDFVLPTGALSHYVTTYAREVCDAELVLMDPTMQSIVDVPSERIQRANRNVDNFLARWWPQRFARSSYSVLRLRPSASKDFIVNIRAFHF